MSSSTREMLTNFSSSMTYVGQTFTLRNGVMTSTGGKLTINNHTYALDDPNAVSETTIQSDRESFWAHCTDKGRDSDLYRAHANKLLRDNKINLDQFPVDVKAQIINKAAKFVELNNFFMEQGKVDWVAQLSDELFKLCLKDPSDLKRLAEYCLQLNKRFFSVIRQIGINYIKILLDNSRDTTELLKTLNEIGCYDKKNLLTKLVALDPATLKLFLDKRHDITKLLTCLSELNYVDPLAVLATMEREKLKLFIDKSFDIVTLMKALAKKGQENPIEFLAKLDVEDIKTICDSRFEYVKRIDRGIDISKEFCPAVDNTMRAELTSFVRYLTGVTKFQERLAKLDIPKSMLEDFLVHIPKKWFQFLCV